jgi:serine/threonine protein kinase
VLAAHPSLADRLRERLHKLERAGLLGPSEDAAAEIPAQLGEFKLQKRLGSGGMGVVFLAEQVSLGRTVALKLVRPEQRFFPGARARFRREVEAVARLGDAGIVPIYSVGQDQGVDFFAMEYVRGASLGDVIAARARDAAERAGGPRGRGGRCDARRAAGADPLPEVFAGTWVQTCCRIVLRMARAAQHAHERGVVHRDLKPNNTMVTPDGRVLLLDFGLAAAAGTFAHHAQRRRCSARCTTWRPNSCATATATRAPTSTRSA